MAYSNIGITLYKYCCIVAWEYCCNVARKHTMEDMSRFRQYWGNLAARLAILL